MNKRNISHCILTLFGLVLFGTSKLLIENAQRVSFLVFQIDPLISQSTQKNIQLAAAELFKQKKAISLEVLKQQFPIIESCSCSQAKSNQCLVTIKSELPWIYMNENEMLTQSGLIVDRSDFAPSIAPMPTIFSMKTAKALCPSLFAWLSAAENALLSQFTVTFENDDTIRVQDAQKKMMALYLNASSHFNAHLINTCQKVQDLLIEKNKLRKKAIGSTLADLRFNNQIVVYANQLQAHDEKKQFLKTPESTTNHAPILKTAMGMNGDKTKGASQ